MRKPQAGGGGAWRAGLGWQLTNSHALTAWPEGTPPPAPPHTPLSWNSVSEEQFVYKDNAGSGAEFPGRFECGTAV